MEFNEKFKELRKQKGLTQEELAEKIFVSRTAVSKWESGKGYPSIDSLKVIASFFNITVDELLKSDELLTLAEADSRKKGSLYRDIVFGLVDISAVLFFFLPFFVKRQGDLVVVSSLLTLSGVAPYLKILYFLTVLTIILSGILTLALQSCENRIWNKIKGPLSLALNAFGIILFVISSMPYAAIFLFAVFIIKMLLTLKVSRV